MKLTFPEKSKPYRYVKSYNRYILESAKAAGLDVSIGPETTVNCGRFLVELDGASIMFDYSDHPDTVDGELGHPCVMKLHTHDWHPKNIHPFPPISFYDWAAFRKLQKEIKYKAVGDVISSRQVPNENALVRRNSVQSMLRNAYGDKAKFSKLGQVEYWREIGECLVQVLVPGCRNHILDRGMGQSLAFGGCVISPHIDTRLPYGKSLVGGEHFIQCRADYADVIDLVEWAKNNREECIKIGERGKRIFAECCEPKPAWAWVAQCAGK